MIDIHITKPMMVIITAALAAAYLLLWPVPIEPVAWDAPENEGYVSDFAPNTKMQGLARVSLNGHSGPEDIALGPDGKLYVPTHDGVIFTYGGGKLTEFAKTQGRPLGIEFGPNGKLFVADAYRGLLEIGPDGNIIVLTNKTDDGSPIRYADDLDVADDGSIYFTDASVKFGAEEFGGTLPASLLDLMEHGPNGRVLKYDPASKSTSVLLDGLSFANGMALTADGSHYLVVETGTYSVLRVPVGVNAEATPILQNLPGFPDNINRNADGTFWIGLVSPRSPAVEFLSDRPFLRKIVQRLPTFMRPKPLRYGFVLRIDEDGNVLETLQDPSGDYALTTGLIEGADRKRYITSLTEPDIGVLPPK
ncbi:MAG: SMP-30/gluconolactonase/LRE family protein [Rhizobiaceae bacterium]